MNIACCFFLLLHWVFLLPAPPPPPPPPPPLTLLFLLFSLLLFPEIPIRKFWRSLLLLPLPPASSRESCFCSSYSISLGWFIFPLELSVSCSEWYLLGSFSEPDTEQDRPGACPHGACTVGKRSKLSSKSIDKQECQLVYVSWSERGRVTWASVTRRRPSVASGWEGLL